MFKGRPFQVSILFILLFFSASFGQDEQWLQYRWSREARQIMREMGSKYIELDSSAPEDAELPQFAGNEQFFGRWETPMAGRGYVQIAFDRDSKYGKANIVYVDSDCDGSLADEEAVKAYNTDQYGGEFGPVRIVFEGEEGPVTYHINIRYQSYDDDRHYMHVYSAGWYEGQIEVNGEKKYCALVDHNMNGLFNDKSSSFSRSDRIVIGQGDNAESSFVGNFVEIDDKLYRPEIAKDGAYIILTEAKDVVFGKIQVPENIASLAVGGENGLFDIDLEAGQGQAPVGEYIVHHWTIEREDDEGKKWELEGNNFSSKTLFDVNEQQAAVLDIGEPIFCTLELRKNGKRRYSFEQELEGRMGERIDINRERRSPKEPQLSVKNQDGSYDRTFNFEYG